MNQIPRITDYLSKRNTLNIKRGLEKIYSGKDTARYRNLTTRIENLDEVTRIIAERQCKKV